MKMFTNILQSWKSFLLVQGLGMVIFVIGSFINVVPYLIGLLMLLPGSVIVALVPSRWFDMHRVEHLTDSDAASIQNLIYLPCAVLINALAFYLVRKTVKAQVKNSEA